VASPYPGRAGDDWDLGGGHSLLWQLADDGTPLALDERHLYGPSGGWHGFTIAVPGLVAGGGPGTEQLLAVAITLTCPACGITGRIGAGRWIPA
jgi:hypothetical protein